SRWAEVGARFRRPGPLLGGAVTSPEGAGPPEPGRAAPRRPGGGRSRTMAAAAAAGAEGRRAALEAAAAAPERGGSCVLCCGELEATALGRCDHPVCYRCSTKMRVLCEQRYCAVCREELRQVVFGKKLPAFATIPLQQLQHEKKYDIYFADGKVFALYRQLLLHECPRCPELPPFGLFADLEQHMRRQHELFCCKLCLKHLKIFTHERKWYSRKDLARHRMQGDPDDTSHRGHPLCKFCDERYLDNDELLKHLRRDHYFCHFCDADGAQDYYSDYAYLREHFRERHFLCEEGRCGAEQFTHAFRTEIDLKAHRTACHSRSRAEARQNRQIDLQFSLTPRHARRGEGVVSGEDYEEVDRYSRQGRAGRAGGRGAQQSRRGSWRYKRWEDAQAASPPQVGHLRQLAGRVWVGPLAAAGLGMAVGHLAAPPSPAPSSVSGLAVAPGPAGWGDLCRHSSTGPGQAPPLKPGRAVQEPWVLAACYYRHAPAGQVGMRLTAPHPREEEDRDVAAAIRASVAVQQPQPQETRRSEDREEGSRLKKEDSGVRGPEEPRGPRRPPRTQGEGSGPKEAWAAQLRDPRCQGVYLQALVRASGQWGGEWGGVGPSCRPLTRSPLPPSTLLPPAGKLKDEDFPSLCACSAAAAAPGPTGLALAYPVPARGRSAFQEEDFPALVSSACRPSPAPTSLISPWNSGGGKKAAPLSTGPPAAGGAGQAARKAGKTGRGGKKGGPAPAEEQPWGGPAAAAAPAPLALASPQPFAKVGKKKKVGSEKLSAASPPPPPPDRDGHEWTPAGRAEGPVAAVVNGHTEGPAPAQSATKEPPGLPRPPPSLPCPPPQEDFPALGGRCLPRMPPPPGFNTVVLLKGTPPPPPPGLVPPVSKPPPGFSSLLPGPHLACIPTAAAVRPPRLTAEPRAYLVPENFRERNLQLIQSIKDFLQSDEARFSEFKSRSGEFRQGVISAAQYYQSCRDLLGENFQKIFGELLVLLPDTAKQQELLSAHTDFRGRERPPGSKARRSRQTAWQAGAPAAGLDCCVCPTCQQVLAQGDLHSHQALHAARDDDFPSLQAVARVLT
ncbi:E3 ubiquitin-protein ligase ZNF598, partial [Galemys pyrenaicus]